VKNLKQRGFDMIYLDNAATTQVCKEAANLAYEVMTEQFGNPSSTHQAGRTAAGLLKTARKQVSTALGCAPEELYFTSCGSESDNWAILRGAESMSRKGKHVITSTVEHDAVRKSMEELERRGYEVTWLSPDSTGAITAQQVQNALRPDTILVSLMLVNNETGAVTDISAISRVLRDSHSSALLHTDGVQAFLKVPFQARTLGADMISISGHKIHAPKGIGALYIRQGMKPASKLLPYLMGGAQENGMRAGTEAMPQIAAFGMAAEIGRKQQSASMAHMEALRAHAVERLSAELPDVVFIGGGAPHILSLSLPGYRSEVLMNFLDQRGICVSRSSACKQGRRSHVLEAMGLSPKIIDGAVRVSFSRYTTIQDVDGLCDGLRDAKASLFTVLG